MTSATTVNNRDKCITVVLQLTSSHLIEKHRTTMTRKNSIHSVVVKLLLNVIITFFFSVQIVPFRVSAMGWDSKKY